MSWRRQHLYGTETYEGKRLRLRSYAEDPRPGIDTQLPDDRRDEYAPAPRWWVDPLSKSCTLPMPVLAGSCSTDTAPHPHLRGAATTSVAGGPGGTSPSATHPPRRKAA